MRGLSAKDERNNSDFYPAVFCFTTLLHSKKPYVMRSKQGRPPRESEKGAVRCCRRTMRGYNYGLYYVGFTTAPLFASFFDPSMEDLLQRHFLLLFGP